MIETALAAVFAVFIWWASTGIVLLLNGMQRRAYRWSLLVSTLLALAALLALAHTAQQTTTASVYCAFTSALLVWGWHELSFLTGWITGPRTTALPSALQQGHEVQRFVQSVRVPDSGGGTGAPDFDTGRSTRALPSAQASSACRRTPQAG